MTDEGVLFECVNCGITVYAPRSFVVRHQESLLCFTCVTTSLLYPCGGYQFRVLLSRLESSV